MRERMFERIDVADLDEFVAAVFDQAGGVEALYGGTLPDSISLTYRTKVDDTLDPFSDEYVQQQIALYEEIAGRTLDQLTGEQAEVGAEYRIDAANPYASRDIRFIAKHSRAILSGLVVANLPDGANVLDMGSGWGLSSEMMAFCGANVTSVDINPQFVDLVRRRAERLGLPITVLEFTFDDFETDDRFDMVFFYECLHHAVRPWTVLERGGGFLKPSGKIVLSGEPYVNFFKHWGLRIKPLSLYCIREVRLV